MWKSFIQFLEGLGVSEGILLLLTGVSLIYGILFFLWKVIIFCIQKNHEWLLNEDLSPYFTKNDITKATKFYIQTNYQNVSPSEDEEPGSKYIASAKNPLIPLFLNSAFKNSELDNKYYLILADAGMGKTTFMINLYLKYQRQWSRIFGFASKKEKMVLFPLGSPDILGKIKIIENKSNTILLLDAFDEDVKALNDYKIRMKEILSVAKDFRNIVITCRTQFFPSEEEEPDTTGYYSFGSEQKEYKFQKLYLSIFDEKDISKYLKKRFSFINRKKRKQAFKIVKKSPNLVMRPMLLSYINDLVDEVKPFSNTNEIYEVLIDKWIKRESGKRGIREKYGSREQYEKLLYEFSLELAVNLYEKKEERGGFYLPQGTELRSELQLIDFDEYSVTEKELQSKSLLNRSAQGKYKFAHKSIFEYFLVINMFKKPEFFKTFDFEGMSAADKFFDEILIDYLAISIGSFVDLSYTANPKLLQHNYVDDLETLVILKFNEVSFNPVYLSKLKNLSELHIYDERKYAPLYDYYVLSPWMTTMGMLSKPQLNEFLNEIKLRKKKKLITNRRPFDGLPTDSLEMRARLHLSVHYRTKKAIPQPHPDYEVPIRVIQKIHRRIESYSSMNLEEMESILIPMNNYIKDIRYLQEKLPDCKIYY